MQRLKTEISEPPRVREVDGVQVAGGQGQSNRHPRHSHLLRVRAIWRVEVLGKEGALEWPHLRLPRLCSSTRAGGWVGAEQAQETCRKLEETKGHTVHFAAPAVPDRAPRHPKVSA